MNKPPAFQFYAKSWLSATRVISVAARGAYMDLLAWSWDNGPIPKSDKAKAGIVGVSEAQFKRLWSEFSLKWQETAVGLVNVRLEQQRSELHAFRQGKVESGRRGAESRWQKDGSAIGSPSKKDGSTSSSTSSSTNQEEDTPTPGDLRELWNEETNGILPQCLKLTEVRRKKAAARLSELPFDQWSQVITKIKKSSFLCGENDRGWRADFDFLIKPDTATRVLEGKYDDRPGKTRLAPVVPGIFTPKRVDEPWERECAELHDSRCAGPNDHTAKMSSATVAS
jgi:uncharacterized protein YdaU (DUF1376 family)